LLRDRREEAGGSLTTTRFVDRPLVPLDDEVVGGGGGVDDEEEESEVVSEESEESDEEEASDESSLSTGTGGGGMSSTKTEVASASDRRSRRPDDDFRGLPMVPAALGPAEAPDASSSVGSSWSLGKRAAGVVVVVMPTPSAWRASFLFARAVAAILRPTAPRMQRTTTMAATRTPTRTEEEEAGGEGVWSAAVAGVDSPPSPSPVVAGDVVGDCGGRGPRSW
jgi:hypothetical protein